MKSVKSISSFKKKTNFKLASDLGRNPGEAEKFRNSTLWKKLRSRHIKEEPFCVKCGRIGRDVDHIKPIEDGGNLTDPNNLQTLCKKCHIDKTKKENKKRHRK